MYYSTVVYMYIQCIYSVSLQYVHGYELGQVPNKDVIQSYVISCYMLTIQLNITVLSVDVGLHTGSKSIRFTVVGSAKRSTRKHGKIVNKR